VTHDVAVWEGTADLSDRAAVEEFERRYRESDEHAEAACARIRRYVDVLLPATRT
jgi:hypothetical protein